MGHSLRRSRLGTAGGFTFVEILAALVFLAVVIPTIVSALSLSSRASELTERGGMAGQLAENKLNEMLTADAWQSAGNMASGDCGTDFPGYHWEITQTPWTGGGASGTPGASSGVGASSSTATTTSSVANSASGTTSTSVNTTVTEMKVTVYFKVQGEERSVSLSTLVNALASTSTTTSTGTPTGGTTP